MNIINLRSWKSIAAVVTAALLFVIGWTTVLAATTVPTITTPTQSTTTDPIILTGTADANADISVTGGESSASTTADGSGNWSVMVDLTEDAANTLSVTASTSEGVSAAATVVITHDITSPSAPQVTVYPQCSTTSPVTVGGTSEANSTIRVTGGTSTSTATTTGAGSWSASVGLFVNTANSLTITATDALGNVSSSTTLTINLDTIAPTITLRGDQNMSVFTTNGFTDPGVSVSDNLDSDVTATTTGQFDSTVPGTYTLTYTVTDCAGNTATTTRTVIVRAASSGSSGGGGNNNPNPPGIAVAASVTPIASLLPGQAIGLTALQLGLQPPGQVLGATTVKVMFTQNMRVGSRGPAVTALQTKLTELGFYRGSITGYFGGLTRAAVVAYQRANGLPQVGQVGPLTRALLNR